MRDPYIVLGVSRSASADDIKKAYRQLAKRLHPDVNPGNRAIEQQFKEVSAAYDLLSDPVKRARFDRGELDAEGRERGFGFRNPGAGTRTHHRAAEADPFSIDDIISELLGRKGRQSTAGSTGTSGRGQEAAQIVRLGFVEAARGGRRRVTLSDGRSLEVTIPAGIDSGQTLRLRSSGMGSRAGDTYIQIEVEPHAVFTRKDRDIHVELPVTLTEAVLGAVINVPTIHGPVALRVPRGSNSGTLLRLRGKGIAATEGQGDQYVRLRVVLPDPPDAELTDFLERWARTHPYDVRGKLDTV
jgi:DnaJ-class molecular chaperone